MYPLFRESKWQRNTAMPWREVEVEVSFKEIDADSQLQCGGGQIVVAGAPQQFSLPKWKLWPTSSHTFILLSILFNIKIFFLSAFGLQPHSHAIYL